MKKKHILTILIILIILTFIYLNYESTEYIYLCADYVCKPENIKFICNKTINTSFVNFC